MYAETCGDLESHHFYQVTDVWTQDIHSKFTIVAV